MGGGQGRRTLVTIVLRMIVPAVALDPEGARPLRLGPVAPFIWTVSAQLALYQLLGEDGGEY